MRTPTINRRSCRCLTLLEVLIALVLLAGLAAMIAPTVLDRLDERAFEAAADGTNEQLMMARAHAQATGEPVEVTWSPQTGEVHARFYLAWNSDRQQDSIEPGTSPLATADRNGRSSDVESSESASRGMFGDSPRSDGDLADAPSARPIVESWAQRPLGRGIRIATHRPSATHGSDFVAEEESRLPDSRGSIASAGDVESDILQDLANGQEVRLAVFMPDGSALVGENLWLNDEGGRCGRISINPWSGLPMFQRLANLTDDLIGAGDDSADPVDGGVSDDDVDEFSGESATDRGFARPDDRRGG